MSYETVEILSTLSISIDDAKKTINAFVDYADKQLGSLNNKFNFGNDTNMFKSITENVKGLVAALDQLEETERKAVVSKQKTVQELNDEERQLQALTEKTYQVEAGFHKALTVVDKYEQQMRKTTLTDKEKTNTLELLSDAYQDAMYETQKYIGAMEVLTDNTKDKKVQLERIKIIENLTQTYQKLERALENVEHDLNSGVSNKATKYDTVSIDAYEQKIKSLNSSIKILQQTEKNKSLSEQSHANAVKDLTKRYDEQVQVYTSYINKLNASKRGLDKEGELYANITDKVNKLRIELAKLKTTRDNLQAKNSNSASMSSFDVTRLRSDVQTLNKLFNAQNISITESQNRLKNLVSSYDKLNAAIITEIDSLKNQQKGLDQSGSAWQNLQTKINAFENEIVQNMVNVENAINKVNTAQTNLANKEMMSGAKASFEQTRQEIELLKASFDRFDTTLEQKQNIMTVVGQKYSELMSKMEAQRNKLTQLQGTTVKGSTAWKQYQTQIDKVESELRSVQTAQEKTNTTLSNGIAKLKEKIAKENEHAAALQSQQSLYHNLQSSLSSTIASYGQFYVVLGQIRNIISTHQEVDAALTETRKVAGLTKDEMREFQAESLETADALGVVQTELINATTEFTRLGIAFDEAKKFGELASIGSVVGDIGDSSAVSNYLIASLNGFRELSLTSADATRVLDMFNEVANNTSINFEALGEGTKRFAASMSTAGNSIEQSLGLLTGGYDVTRDAEKVATALNTISLRLRGINDEGEEELELVPKMEETFKKYGLTLLDVTEDGVVGMKSTYEILKDISGVWDELSKDEFALTNILEAMSGKRHANTLAAILESWDTVEKTVQLAMNSVGSADEEYGYYLESMDAATNRFKNSISQLYQTVISSDALIGLIEQVTELIKVVTQVDPVWFKMLGAFTLTQAATHYLATGLLGVIKSVTSLTSAFQGVNAMGVALTGTMRTLNLTMGVMGFLPIIAAVVIGLTNWCNKVAESNTITNKLADQQDKLNQRMSESDQILNDLTDMTHQMASGFDEMGNAISEVDMNSYLQTISSLKDLYPELATQIDEVVASYEDEVEVLEKLRQLIREQNIDDHVAALNENSDALNKAKGRYNELSKELTKSQNALNKMTADGTYAADQISFMNTEVKQLTESVNEEQANIDALTNANEKHINSLQQMGVEIGFVDGQYVVLRDTVAEVNEIFLQNADALAKNIAAAYDLTTAEGLLAAAFVEMAAKGQLGKGTLELLQQRFGETTAAAFTSADAIISFSNANNLATVQILKDNNSWIKSSQNKCKQAIQEMRILKQQADSSLKYINKIGEAKYDRLYDKGFDPALSDGVSQSSGYYKNLSNKLAQDIKNAEAELKYYESITAAVNQLSVPVSSTKVPSSTYSPSSSSGGSGSSGSSSSNKDKQEAEEKIDYAEKFAGKLQEIAKIEHEIAKIEAKMNGPLSDKERVNSLKEVVRQQQILVNTLKDHQNAIQQEMKTVKVGSEAYNELLDMLRDVELQIIDTTNAQAKYNTEIFNLKKEIEDFDLSKLDYELEVLERLFNQDNISLIEKQEYGNKMLSKYDAQKKEVADVIKLLKEEQKIYNQNSSEWRDLQQQIWDYELKLIDLEQQKLDIVNSINDELLKTQEDYVNKQIDLIKEELDAKLDAIDKEKEALQNAKKEKEDAEKRKAIEDGIADIQNEMASLSSDDSLWAKKRMYELQKALEEKEKQLKDLEEQTEYEKKLAELEAKKQELQEEANKKIDSLNAALKETVDGFSKVTTNLSHDIKNVMDTFVVNLANLLQYGTTTTVPNVGRSMNNSTTNTFNVNINAGNNSSGSRLATDFITTLQARGYKI